MGIQTEEYMGRNQLIERLSAQVGDRRIAIKILQTTQKKLLIQSGDLLMKTIKK